MANAQTTLIIPVAPGLPGPITQHEMVLDTINSDFQATSLVATTERAFLLSFQVLSSAAGILTIKRGSTTVITYNFAANSGASFQAAENSFLLAGDVNQELFFRTSVATVTIVAHTVQATAWGVF